MSDAPPLFECPRCGQIGNDNGVAFSLVRDATRQGVYCMRCWNEIVDAHNPMMDRCPAALECLGGVHLA